MRWTPISVEEALRIVATCRPIQSLYAHENGAWWVEPGCEAPQAEADDVARPPLDLTKMISADVHDDSFVFLSREGEVCSQTPEARRCVVQ